MTRNRLTEATSASPIDFGPMAVGDVRTVHVKDKAGTIVRTITIRRTMRSYAHDLADAYNEVNPHATARWFVNESGELIFGYPYEFSARLTGTLDRAKERQRKAWIANHRERA